MNCLGRWGVPSTFYNPGVEPMDDRSSEGEVLCSVECMFVGVFFLHLSFLKKYIFLMWTILKVFIEFVTVLFCFMFFCFLF